MFGLKLSGEGPISQLATAVSAPLDPAWLNCLTVVNPQMSHSLNSCIPQKKHYSSPLDNPPDNHFKGKSVYFFVVWSFLLFGLFGCFFFAVWAWACFFFLLFGRGPRPRPNSKKVNTPTRPNSKTKKHARKGRGRVIFFAVWAGACSFFCCLGGGRVLFFAVWAGRVFFLLFGRGTGVHSLTRLPGSSLSDPTTKETEQQKKKKHTGSPL